MIWTFMAGKMEMLWLLMKFLIQNSQKSLEMRNLGIAVSSVRFRRGIG
jgi:hypothetical protein